MLVMFLTYSNHLVILSNWITSEGNSMDLNLNDSRMTKKFKSTNIVCLKYCSNIISPKLPFFYWPLKNAKVTTITEERKVCIFSAAKFTVSPTQLPRCFIWKKPRIVKEHFLSVRTCSVFSTSICLPVSQTSIKLKKKTAKVEFNAKKILEKTSSYSEQTRILSNQTYTWFSFQLSWPSNVKRRNYDIWTTWDPWMQKPQRQQLILQS